MPCRWQVRPSVTRLIPQLHDQKLHDRPDENMTCEKVPVEAMLVPDIMIVRLVRI